MEVDLFDELVSANPKGGKTAPAKLIPIRGPGGTRIQNPKMWVPEDGPVLPTVGSGAVGAAVRAVAIEAMEAMEAMESIEVFADEKSRMFNFGQSDAARVGEMIYCRRRNPGHPLSQKTCETSPS